MNLPTVRGVIPFIKTGFPARGNAVQGIFLLMRFRSIQCYKEIQECLAGIGGETVPLAEQPAFVLGEGRVDSAEKAGERDTERVADLFQRGN